MPKINKLTGRIFIFLFALSALAGAIFLTELPVYAEPGDGDGGGGDDTIIHIYHDYYIPWPAGADNCYGAYRVAVTDGEASRNIFDGGLTRNYRGGWNFDSKSPAPLVYSNDTRRIRRDDLIVVTDFALGAYREEHLGNEIHHHTYHYETPYFFGGLSVVMSPVGGVPEQLSADGLSHIVLTRKLAHQYFLEDISYDAFTLLLVPGFGGANPDGTIVRRAGGGTHFQYILSLSPALPESVGWWRMLSVETMGFINKVRSNPGAYTAPASPSQLAELERAKNKALAEERKVNPGASAKPFDAGYTWDTPRIFYSPEMFGGFKRTSLQRASGLRNTYSYGEDFLTPFEMHHTWRLAGDKVAAGLFGNLPAPETEKVQVSMNSASGWRIPVVTDNEPVVIERVVSPPQAILIKPPFTEGSAFDSFRALSPGTWGYAGEGPGGLSITTQDARALARWPFGYAQNELYRKRLSTRDRLDEKATSDEAIAGVISRAGGVIPFSASVGAWKVPSQSVDGSLAQGVPGGEEFFSSYEPALIVPGTTPAGASAWEQWAKRDRKFYDSLIPYMSTSLGLLFWEAPGWGGLYMNKGIERFYRPEIFFSGTGTGRTEFGISLSDIKALGGKDSAWLASDPEYGKRYASARDRINQALDMHEKKASGKDNEGWEIIWGKVSREGKEHISHTVKSSIRYIPMRLSDALSGIKRDAWISSGIASGAVNIPVGNQTLTECQGYFPIDGTVSSPVRWPAPAR